MKLLLAKISANIGALDGMMETGTVRSCNGDNITIGLSVGTSAASFASGFPQKFFGRLGGGLSSLFTAINVGRGGKLTASDLFTILAGAAGFAATFPGWAAVGSAAAVFTVSGIAATLYDNFKYNDGNSCTTPPGMTPGQAAQKLALPLLLSPIIPPNLLAAMLASPLIIDMDGNGIKTISINKNVLFDLDNNLFAENTGWVDKGDAFLVWDRDGNGTIDSGNELFGNHSLLQNGEKAANGFAALAELDGNKDNVFDASDEAWTRLQLWFDHNQNGISEEGELIKLADSQIKSINLNYQDINRTDESGNTHRQHSSVTWTDGKTTDINDVWFATNPALSYSRQQIEISDEIKALPNVIAFGNVLNLHQAMATNSMLKNQITVK